MSTPHRCPSCPLPRDAPGCPAAAHLGLCGEIAGEVAGGGPAPRRDALLAGLALLAPAGDGPRPCRHLATRWNCGGECTTTCALGRGQAGIIDRHDCEGCPDAAG